jgi:hypothetical protein
MVAIYGPFSSYHSESDDGPIRSKHVTMKSTRFGLSGFYSLILREHKAMYNFKKEEIIQTVVQVTFGLRVLAKADYSLQNGVK